MGINSEVRAAHTGRILTEASLVSTMYFTGLV